MTTQDAPANGHAQTVHEFTERVRSGAHIETAQRLGASLDRIASTAQAIEQQWAAIVHLARYIVAQERRTCGGRQPGMTAREYRAAKRARARARRAVTKAAHRGRLIGDVLVLNQRDYTHAEEVQVRDWVMSQPRPGDAPIEWIAGGVPIVLAGGRVYLDEYLSTQRPDGRATVAVIRRDDDSCYSALVRHRCLRLRTPLPDRLHPRYRLVA